MNTNNNNQTMTTEEIIKLGNEQQDEQVKVVNQVIHDLYNFNHSIINKLDSLQEQIKALQEDKNLIRAYVNETSLSKIEEKEQLVKEDYKFITQLLEIASTVGIVNDKSADEYLSKYKLLKKQGFKRDKVLIRMFGLDK